MAARFIYLVDDDELVRAWLLSLLSPHQNLLIFPFGCGEDFLAEIDERPGGVVLLDYNMPGIDGLEVLRRISSATPKFGVVVLTAQGATRLVVEAWKLGAIDFLEKPCEPAVLLEVVNNAFSTVEQDQHARSVVHSAKTLIGTLTPREADVLTGLVKGNTNKDIAQDLDISPRTIEIYRANMMQKLGVRNLSEALRIAFAANFVGDD